MIGIPPSDPATSIAVASYKIKCFRTDKTNGLKAAYSHGIGGCLPLGFLYGARFGDLGNVGSSSAPRHAVELATCKDRAALHLGARMRAHLPPQFRSWLR